jgi:hypothetical protein
MTATRKLETVATVLASSLGTGRALWLVPVGALASIPSTQANVVVVGTLLKVRVQCPLTLTTEEPAPVNRVRYLDRVAVELKPGSNVMMRGMRFSVANSTTFQISLKVATQPTTGIDWDNAKKQVVQWFGSPMRYLTNLDRLAFECPPGSVPTKLYFKRAGCNEQNVFALKDKRGL